MAINIVLVEPEIPQNTGNIARTCRAIHATLHLVRPLGFSLEDRYLKRAGLDYWERLNMEYHDNLHAFFKKYSDGNFFYATTKGGNNYANVQYPEGCFILFGKETAGLPKELLAQNPETSIRIPMAEGARSLNLANSVGIIAYEAMRQLNFLNLD